MSSRISGSGKGNSFGESGVAPHFEAELFTAAERLRGNMDRAQYKHVVLGLIFLKYLSDAFIAKREDLLRDKSVDAEEPKAYGIASVFWVPEEARWSHLAANVEEPDLGKMIDDATFAIEKSNCGIRNAFPKDYARLKPEEVRLEELVSLVTGIGMAEEASRSCDLLRHVYDHFLESFAAAEGGRGGEFQTPRSVVRLLVELLEPSEGRVYDPCCGSGKFLVESVAFARQRNGHARAISVYGQDMVRELARLAEMGLAMRSAAADIRWSGRGSFHEDEFADLQADFVFADPPFNFFGWGGEQLQEDARWQFGKPPVGNANYAWLQHVFHHLAPGGVAGVVSPNGAMSSDRAGEGDIRRAMVEAGAVDCIIALPGQLFYPTQIPACLWLLSKAGEAREAPSVRHDEMLFIDARRLGNMADRTRRVFSDEDVSQVVAAYRAWRGVSSVTDYADVPGFCKSATLDDVRAHGHKLTPGRYVGVPLIAEEDERFAERMHRLAAVLQAQQAESACLDAAIVDTIRLLNLAEGNGNARERN